MPSVARILEIAPVACYLSANNVAKKQLFGRTVDPDNPKKIYNVYKILKHVYDKDPTYDGLQERCNYLYELMKRWAIAAGAIVDAGGGGSVAPVTPTTDNIYPFVITSADFSTATTYEDSRIAGDNIMLFINEYSQQWLTSTGNFTYLAGGGFTIIIPGFDANQYDYTIVVQKLGS